MDLFSAIKLPACLKKLYIKHFDSSSKLRLPVVDSVVVVDASVVVVGGSVVARNEFFVL